jgi:hypothetical protein
MILIGESRSTRIKSCPNANLSTTYSMWNFVEIIVCMDINNFVRIYSYLGLPWVLRPQNSELEFLMPFLSCVRVVSNSALRNARKGCNYLF